MTDDTIRRPTLVNFRASPTELRRFDIVCAVAGKTRTQVLIEMMQEHVAQASAAISKPNVKQTMAERVAKIDLKPFSRPIDPGAVRAPLETTNLLETARTRCSRSFWDRVISKMYGDRK